MLEPLQGHTVAHVFSSFPDIKKNIRFTHLLWGSTAFERRLLLSTSNRFHLSFFFFFFKYFCHKVRTNTNYSGWEKKADFLLNWEQRWPIKGLLETHHYSHFGLETLNGKCNHLLNFIFADVATSGGETEASLRAVWGWDERACQGWYPDNGNSANSGIRVNSNYGLTGKTRTYTHTDLCLQILLAHCAPRKRNRCIHKKCVNKNCKYFTYGKKNTLMHAPTCIHACRHSCTEPWESSKACALIWRLWLYCYFP